MDTNIEYTISSSGEISPITPQPGGVLGDDNTVTLSVDLSAITVLENEYIRIDIANGSGGFFSSEHLSLANGKVTYTIPYEVTIAGGTAQAHLVIVQYDGDVKRVRYSFPMRIYFKDSTAGNARYCQELSGLMLKAKEEADRANECSAAAQSLMEESQRQATAANDSAEAAANAYRAAADSAVRAKGYADSISESAERAKLVIGYANAAATSAENASNSANIAESSAQYAASCAESSAASNESARNYASAAASMSDTAATSAENAAASAAEASGAVSTHNTAKDAHENRFSIIQSQLDQKVPTAYVTGAIADHNTSANAHEVLFGTLSTRVDGLDYGLGAAVTKLNILQTHPCYEYSASGGNVQRFDDVSEIAHNIGITVHGATDSDGRTVTNPTVNVYGKNLFKFASLTASGYTFSGSNCKIVNPTSAYHYCNGTEFTLNPGTYTYSCTVSGEVEYTASNAFRTFYKLNSTDYTLNMDGFGGGTQKYSATFTVTAPTTFTFKNVWFYGTPASANLSLDFQLEVGGKMTDYEPYIEPQTASPLTSFGEGEVFLVETFTAVSPTMTVVASDDNNLISTVDVVYNADLMKRIAKIEAAIAAQA